MEDDLRRYHGIAPERVRVTGWPQTDLFHRIRPRADVRRAAAPLRARPRATRRLVAGNTPSNAPYEGRFVERLVEWWDRAPRATRLQLLFRPHPRDTRWQERFAAAVGHEGTCVQEASYIGHRGARDAAPARGCRRLQRGHDPARRARRATGRPSASSTTRARRRASRGRRRTSSASTTRSSRRPARSIAPSASRRSSPASSARSCSRTELAAARRRAVEQVVGTVDGRAAERVVDAAPRSSGSPWDEARDDAPRAGRGGRRRRAGRVPSPCRRRLRRSRSTTRRATGRRRSSSGTSAPASCGSSASRLTTCARTTWVTADGAARGDRPRRRLGDQLGCGRVLVAARRLAEGRARDGARPVRRRPRLLAPLPAAPGRRRVLRGAHDRPPRDARRSGRQGDDLPRPPEGRAPRARRTSRSSAGTTTPRRRGSSRSAPGIRSRSCTSRFRSLAQLERKARGGWLRSPGYEATGHRQLLDEAFRSGTLAAHYASFAVDDEALERGLAEGTLAVDTRLRDALRDLRADDGTFVLPCDGRRLAFPRPTASEDAAYAAEASVLVEIDGIVRAEHRVRALERRLEALEEGPRRVARRLARR